ncbi:hypothetical protein F511_32820 [Dorcoceras hygrometricum]|uniref:Uncharacterized protein n=1 Tax=Dorcoceras hygrometricum TaxID=472368 RepID=A0A2Z7ATK8_9LAMI|nr:hypothetical protein F511_32820 [Dorcoceras hygrometricum]
MSPSLATADDQHNQQLTQSVTPNAVVPTYPNDVVSLPAKTTLTKPTAGSYTLTSASVTPQLNKSLAIATAVLRYNTSIQLCWVDQHAIAGHILVLTVPLTLVDIYTSSCYQQLKYRKTPKSETRFNQNTPSPEV